MCGEYMNMLKPFVLELGSPPHVWGILACGIWLKRCFRITPTCVGNTFYLLPHFNPARDHPHMCGEYTLLRRLFNGCLGSPPHVWGIQFSIRSISLFNRITPTCVGNTSHQSPNSAQPEDHPHMCGEYNSLDSGGLITLGSPPHVWGIHTSLFVH